ncbi:hypothetical protein LT330_001906 [Penicillium expansum]|uniref:3,4-dihydroxy-2-butanone 4-phosphate synthase n=1 Tax=Penicillium expansum TaxID=27334 RepID=A0A0A2K3Z0_PENEN|nr:3,4-dihydroxy-2-butanone 4-phosphate synthase, RibB [Penicillium expansum]KAJ5505416.1 3-4-dihydroxy-2-butanone 4-phosphate synthase RibB [Penicillium expansum]KAK4865283.1 hypothetical protein LT330_001906 [Penicillium expansum]KGO48806.1 3,4-dihydroxy-2-butanone 4-phosphate synthase, RibB [Penicillium expansum]KGO50223.1 3,4-dihydroxy-2-butanone 4-phosphate synthase, RibB [Penicillium expansum]KGO61628.1 3,4-dihydroxy-2-butanone 4-phosphate synthase, RibB [Penicillium expansum]
MPSPTEIAHQFDSIEDTIAAFKNGEFIIVLDSQDRENEGDLIIAAESITAAQMAFLVRYTSGLICAPITPDLATRLALPQMVTENADPKCTAYTVTIDSSDDSVTTGISAEDRALTCRTLASPTAQIDSFRRPGHIIPLQARPGGVRERTGHTEAAVDFCKLAGKAPAGVIAELVEDGEIAEGVAEIGGNNGMMRRDGCLRFGKKWGIKVCTIEDLVIYLDRVEGTGAAANGKH